MTQKSMRKGRSKRQQKLRVIWETVPDPDPAALQKALKMLFGFPPYGNRTLRSGSKPKQVPAGEQQELPF